MDRRIVDGLVGAGMAVLPFAIGVTPLEAKRVLLLAGIYLLVSFLTGAKAKSVVTARIRLVLDLVMAGFIFALAWFESFPAWNPSAEVGMYLVCGIAVLSVALTAGPSRTTAHSSH